MYVGLHKSLNSTENFNTKKNRNSKLGLANDDATLITNDDDDDHAK